jgi:hypothetical protein
MPSGYQQNQNQITPGDYSVSIVMNGGVATWPTTNTLTTSGAVEPYNWDTFTTYPTSLANATRLAQGNLRFEAIIEELTKFCDGRILSVTVTSAGTTDANNQPTALSFTVSYDRDAFILGSYQAVMLAENSSNTTFVGYGGGSNYVNTTVKAIREMVTRGIIRGTTSGYSKSWRVYNPVTLEDTTASVTIRQPDVPANIWGDITVTQISGTTLGS